MKGLVFGGGSAGRSYLLAGAQLGHLMFLHERDFSKSVDLKQEIAELTLIQRLEDLESIFDYIVISTTSDSHLELATRAVALNPRFLVVEKLLTNNLSDLDALVLLQKSNPQVCFVTHNRWELLGITSRIFQLIEKYELGNLVSFNSVGGAMCLASGAIHWLASLNDLFTLNQVEFELSGDLIFLIQKSRANFDIVNGVMQLQIGEKQIRFEYSEQSRVTPIQLLLFEQGYISIHFSGEYQVFRSNLSKQDTLRRYGLAVQCEQGNLIVGCTNPFEILLRSLDTDNYEPPEFLGSVRATELILLAMQLTQKRKLTHLDLEFTRLNSNAYMKSWRIT